MKAIASRKSGSRCGAASAITTPSTVVRWRRQSATQRSSVVTGIPRRMVRWPVGRGADMILRPLR